MKTADKGMKWLEKWYDEIWKYVGKEYDVPHGTILVVLTIIILFGFFKLALPVVIGGLLLMSWIKNRNMEKKMKLIKPNRSFLKKAIAWLFLDAGGFILVVGLVCIGLAVFTATQRDWFGTLNITLGAVMFCSLYIMIQLKRHNNLDGLIWLGVILTIPTLIGIAVYKHLITAPFQQEIFATIAGFVMVACNTVFTFLVLVMCLGETLVRKNENKNENSVE